MSHVSTHKDYDSIQTDQVCVINREQVYKALHFEANLVYLST